ncbi:C4-dicarboxylate ABC transporter substrate-binding protein [Bradyrhizobium sp. Arg62]|uniref:TAXI family TRAP transporter solute-binding subunit n=1 Tax=Bradyrhizobium brasilense TaxID=1419277 RepID=UPI001E3DE068|nr:TAXI family TRAP transporter solute-binding subunit [Bradyrhizobium brasilense]MCC8943595.1 C4-dicarboxylate ABC transporter substrate-binding protein [Bradyrhizobium brasilense]
MISIKVPFWLRFVSLLGVILLCTAAGLYGYRWYNRPVTLTLAVGSIDGEAASAMSMIANQLASDGASVRLKVVDTGTAIEAGKQFTAGNVDLAAVRGDVGDLSQAQAIVVLSHVTVLLIAPPGSSIDGIDKLKGRTVGVLGGEVNAKVVDALNNAYDLARNKAVFKNLSLQDARQAVQSKQVSALLVVIPLTQKYLTLVKGFFPQGTKATPVLIPIDSAAAIAEANRAYESFDVPKGTLRGSPPVPDDDLTTLRTSLYLVARKSVSADVATSLTQSILKVRRELLGENPLFAQITAPSTDADAYLPVHPGALAVYNATTQSFMDEYGNYIYLGPMILGGIASVLAAAWKFLGIGQPEFREGPLDTLYGLARRIRTVNSDSELSGIEEEIDNILKAERLKAEAGDENAVDAATLNVVAHRLENLIHDRRAMLLAKPPIAAVA